MLRFYELLEDYVDSDFKKASILLLISSGQSKGQVFSFDISVVPRHNADMVRPLRIEYPGAAHHVTSRGKAWI